MNLIKGKIVGSVFIFAILIVSISACTNLQTKKLSGKDAYELKQYAVAFRLLTKEFDKAANPDSRSYIAYLAGRSANALHNPNDAIAWFRKSVDIQSREESMYALGKAYKQTQQYPEAKGIFAELTRKHKKKAYIDQYKSLERILEQKLHIADPSFEIKKLNANSNFNDYSPVMMDDRFVLFASDRPSDESTEEYNWNGNYFSDLYIMDVDGKSLIPFDNSLNTSDHEGSACFNSSYTEIYFTRCTDINLRDKHCRIYVSNKERGEWTDPAAITFFDEGVNVGHPTLMGGDSLLIFSVGPHGNYDSYDLYYSRRLPTGWTKAAYLEGAINTEASEKFPTSLEDTLYFSSDQISGLGGLDIYKTWLDDEGIFTRPIAMPSPINCGADDFGYLQYVSDQENPNIEMEGMFCSSRGDAANDNILGFTKRKADIIEDDIDPEPKEEEKEVAIYLAGKFLDKSTGDKLGAVEVEITNFQNIRKLSDENGNAIFDGAKGIVYKIKASKQGYFAQTQEVSSFDLIFKEGALSHTVNFKMEMDPIVLDKEIVIDDIFYDFDKWNIRDDAKVPLEKLAKMLEENPGISIELASHTDCRGEAEYNRELSQKRANSAINYISSRGILITRLQSQGYGAAVPAIDCACADCTEEEHQSNRRTTFKVLGF